jgi:hypothetical protein
MLAITPGPDQRPLADLLLAAELLTAFELPVTLSSHEAACGSAWYGAGIDDDEVLKE